MSSDQIQSSVYLTVIGPEAVIQSLGSLEGIEGVTLGEAQPLDGLADAADAPLGPDELKLLLEFITVGLGLGAATLKFIEAMLSLLKKSEKTPAHEIIILDGHTNQEILRIDENTNAVNAAQQLKAWSTNEK
ncbi:hypothetical protein [Rhizobium laguerreae]|uniref:hypothetical protein n=1 Tax=Rhizobium laguerreae TaxID=1076926 RepID=UPI001C908349|nr:hypothetical protein [Rhizobium laguerreae]MBY3132286.1 hypothetical protein [Rhizobium laguerreae]